MATSFDYQILDDTFVLMSQRTWRIVLSDPSIGTDSHLPQRFVQCKGSAGPKFLHFHAVFGKNWPNNRLAPNPFGVSAPSSGKSWIHHWSVLVWPMQLSRQWPVIQVFHTGLEGPQLERC